MNEIEEKRLIRSSLSCYVRKISVQTEVVPSFSRYCVRTCPKFRWSLTCSVSWSSVQFIVTEFSNISCTSTRHDSCLRINQSSELFFFSFLKWSVRQDMLLKTFPFNCKTMRINDCCTSFKANRGASRNRILRLRLLGRRRVKVSLKYLIYFSRLALFNNLASINNLSAKKIAFFTIMARDVIAFLEWQKYVNVLYFRDNIVVVCINT